MHGEHEMAWGRAGLFGPVGKLSHLLFLDNLKQN